LAYNPTLVLILNRRSTPG